MAITGRSYIFQNIAQGKGFHMSEVMTTPGSNISVANFNSGSFQIQLFFGPLSTLNTTLRGFVMPPQTTNPNRLVQAFMHGGFVANAAMAYLVRIYLIGTLSLTATGNQFTHNAATFPLTRTTLGATNNVTLLPVVNITTATSTTAPAFILKASGGTAGYTNQAGSGIVGTKTFTFNLAATTVNTNYMLRLEDGDSGVQDITQIDITTASSTGAANIYGLELLAPLPLISSSLGTIADPTYRGLSLPDLNPAVATTGTVTSYLGVMMVGTGSVANIMVDIQSVEDV